MPLLKEPQASGLNKKSEGSVEARSPRFLWNALVCQTEMRDKKEERPKIKEPAGASDWRQRSTWHVAQSGEATEVTLPMVVRIQAE